MLTALRKGEHGRGQVYAREIDFRRRDGRVRFSDLQRRRSEMTGLIYNYVEIRMRMLGDNKPKPKPALLGVCLKCKGAGWVCDSIGAISICNGCYNPTCKPAP